MPKKRVVRDAEERKDEILDAAARLFVTKGFDDTSTTDILNEVGIARGTLYYHFASKQDILDAVIERLTRQLLGAASEIAGNKGIPPMQRLTSVIAAMQADGPLGQALMEQVHRPQNALLHQKMQERLLAGLVPLIAGIIEEGCALGLCQTDYPTEVAEMTLLYANTVFDALAMHSPDEKKRKAAAFIANTERLLGMEPGALHSVIQPLLAV